MITLNTHDAGSISSDSKIFLKEDISSYLQPGTIYAKSGHAFGTRNVVGTMGYSITSIISLSNHVTWQKEGNFYILSGDDTYFDGKSFDSRIKGQFYSLNTTYGSTNYCGKIIDISLDNKRLSASYVIDVDKSAIYGMFFPEHPEYGLHSVTGTGGAAITGDEDGGFSESYGCYAEGPCSHAEGYNTRASGKYAHVEGNATKAGWAAHAEGSECNAFAECSHVEGRYNEIACTAKRSHASGNNVYINTPFTFAWSCGNLSESQKSTSEKYNPKNPGSFNVDPQNGLSGFFIGDQNFIECVISACELLSSDTSGKKTRLKNALNAIMNS